METAPFPFVWVNDDGTVRELTAEEREYLETEFQSQDPARPYFKETYSELTPLGKLRGFLARDNVPAGMKVREV